MYVNAVVNKMKGYFTVQKNQKEKFDIECSLNCKYAKNEVPEKQQELYLEMENVNNVIKTLHHTEDVVKEKYFNKLLSLTQAGLVGNTAQPSLALRSLEVLKEEIIFNEGKRIKNSYIKRLGSIAGVIFLILILIYLIFQKYEFTQSFLMYLRVFMGSLVGTWISFGVRKFNIIFEHLSIIEEDMMEPFIRLIYIGICSIILLLFLNTGFLSINIGNLSTSEIKVNNEMQCTIGILCGLIESKIGINIYNKAITIFK